MALTLDRIGSSIHKASQERIIFAPAKWKINRESVVLPGCRTPWSLKSVRNSGHFLAIASVPGSTIRETEPFSFQCSDETKKSQEIEQTHEVFRAGLHIFDIAQATVRRLTPAFPIRAVLP